MANFGSVGMGVLLAALLAGASARLMGCEPSRSSANENASQVDKTRKDESITGADRGSGMLTASPAPSKTEEAARPEPSGGEGKTKSDSPKGKGKENKDEDGEFVVRDAQTGQEVSNVKIKKLDPNQKADDVADYGYDSGLRVIQARNRDAAGHLIPRETLC